jgi:hypothetical protein|tara:strand:+ start:526 stop:765 length:240 start_codon:yes stop_codon:yes gene_type:complete
MSTNIDPILEEAAEEAEELMRAMEDCGFDGCCVAWSNNYWVLFVEGVVTLACYGECPLEAIDALHKRVVDSFYREPIQA